MNIVPWNDANENKRREGEVEEDAEEETIVASTNGKTVITKPPPSSSSSSSTSWMKSKDPRIVRVSRAFGGKDRHSKVTTLRGLRDRRVRLSVPTAIQLYDLQERLGLDQPSKAVDWLLDAAKEEIDELPPLPVSPESFSLFNHHQPFLNLGQRPGQDPTQIGFKINVDESTTTTREENDVVFANGSYGTYHQEQEHSFQGDYHNHHHQQHQLHSLVPFPSQILVCPVTTTSSTITTTIQSLFPSSPAMETTTDRRSHFQMPLMGNSSSSTSQNISSLYSLLHGGSSSSNNGGGSNINNRILSSVQFNQANSAALANMSRLQGSESRTSTRGSDQHMGN